MGCGGFNSNVHGECRKREWKGRESIGEEEKKSPM